MTWLILTALSIYALAFIVAGLRKIKQTQAAEDGEAASPAIGKVI